MRLIQSSRYRKKNCSDGIFGSLATTEDKIAVESSTDEIKLILNILILNFVMDSNFEYDFDSVN